MRKEKFSGPRCQRNVADLAGSLVTSSRPPGRLQRRPDGPQRRRCWRRAVSEVWMQQSVMYCGTLCCADTSIHYTTTVSGVTLWCISAALETWRVEKIKMTVARMAADTVSQRRASPSTMIHIQLSVMSKWYRERKCFEVYIKCFTQKGKR